MLSSPKWVLPIGKVSIIAESSGGQQCSTVALVLMWMFVLFRAWGRKSQGHLCSSPFPLSVSPTAAKDLVSRLLVVDPKKRYTAHQVLQHPWIETVGKASTANLQKEVAPSSEGHFRSQHKRAAEQPS